jgi:hypothetical protein
MLCFVFRNTKRLPMYYNDDDDNDDYYFLLFSEGEARRSSRSEINTEKARDVIKVSTTSTCSCDVWNIDLEIV